jgi:CO/xanthine dehydrogenase Mo-binding subunit
MTDSVRMWPKMIGARVKRAKDSLLLTGRRNFIGNRQEANASHFAFHRSYYPHARFITINISKKRAASLPLSCAEPSSFNSV